MKKFAMAVAALLVAAAPADHGGKIKWTHSKNPKDYDALIEQSNRAGKPTLLYFTMDG